MNIKEYERLLEDLKIAGNKTARETKDILEIKLNEFIDIQNDEMIERVTEAIDFAEAQMDVLDTGIALVEEAIEKKEDFSELKSQATEKKSKDLDGGQAVTANTQFNKNAQSVNVSNASEQLWFHSINGSDSIDRLFVQALDELKYKQWETAKRMFDSIISMEMHNPGAALGKMMAVYGISNIDDLYTCSDNRFERDVNLQRAFDYGNTEQKKFINTLRKEREQKWMFDKAMRQKNNARCAAEYMIASKIFDDLGDYSTAKSQAENCRILAEDLRERERQAEEERKFQQKINDLVNEVKDSELNKAEDAYRQLEAINAGAIGGERPVSDVVLNECKERIQKKRKYAKEKKASNYIAIIGIIFCLMMGVPFTSGLFGYLPAPAYSLFMEIDESDSPYLISFGPIQGVEITNSKIKSFIMPFANLAYANFSCTDLGKKFVAPDAESVRLSSCETVETIRLDASTEFVDINNCPKLSEIYVTKNIGYISIKYSPNAKIIWPEGFDYSDVYVENDLNE